MSINRRMDKEGVVHIYDGMLLGHKEELKCHFQQLGYN